MNAVAPARSPKTIALIIGALLGPPLIYTLWLIPTESGLAVREDLAWLVYPILAVAFGVGLLCVWKIEMPRDRRIASLLFYVLGMPIFLFYYTFLIAGYVFDNWL